MAHDPKLVAAVADTLFEMDGEGKVATARAVLDAIDESGTHLIAPIKATAEMARRYRVDVYPSNCGQSAWRVMLDAHLAEQKR